MHKKKETFAGILFVLPAVWGFIIFTLIPMIASFFISLTDYSGYGAPDFVGFQNYINLFDGTDRYFLKTLKNTGIFTLLNVPAQIIFAFFLALLINGKMKGRGFFRALFYFPSIIPIIASTFMWRWILNPSYGILNTVLEFLHLPTCNWFYDEKTVIPSIVLMGLWGAGSSIGTTFLVFVAALQGVPAEYYEAIEMDGGGSLQKLIYITIPMVTPTIFFNLILTMINSFQVFNQAYLITKGGPSDASLFYVYNLWREAFQNASMGKASALSWILFVIILVMSIILNVTQKKWVYYEEG